MSAKNVFYTLLLISLIAGCVPSLHELYTDDVLTYDPKLVGCWETGQDEQWCFTRRGQEDAYDLIIIGREEDKETRSLLVAHLVDLEGRRYLDLYPSQDADLCTGDWYKLHLQPVHTFMQVRDTDPNLVMAIMQPDEVRSLLRRKPDLIPHEIVDERVVLTASTRRLQAFLADPGIAEQIFDAPGYLTPYKP